METTNLAGKVDGYLSPHRTLLSTGSLPKAVGGKVGGCPVSVWDYLTCTDYLWRKRNWTESGLVDSGSSGFALKFPVFSPSSCRRTLGIGNEGFGVLGVSGLVSFEYTTRFIHLFPHSPDPSVHCSIPYL